MSIFFVSIASNNSKDNPIVSKNSFINNSTGLQCFFINSFISSIDITLSNFKFKFILLFENISIIQLPSSNTIYTPILFSFIIFNISLLIVALFK